MKKYINDKSPFSNSLDEMDGQVLIFEGHDRPRYIYPFNNEAGYLGLDDWSQYWNKPTYSSEVVGKLDATKYYSIVVVPVKTDISVGGLPIYGEATKPSIPQKPTAALRGFIFNIPTHTQTVIKDCGIAYSTENDAVTDDDKTWTVNEHIGKTLKNVETGITSSITANTATSITSAGAVFNSGERYQITSISVKARLVYACEMASAFSVNTSNYYLAGVINDNTTTTFTMSSFVESADIWDFDAGFLAPPSASSVKNVSGVMFCGGGITEERGVAKIERTVEAIEAQSDVATILEYHYWKGANLTVSGALEGSGEYTVTEMSLAKPLFRKDGYSISIQSSGKWKLQRTSGLFDIYEQSTVEEWPWLGTWVKLTKAITEVDYWKGSQITIAGAG